ncbi:MAG: carboxypeptidase-like regulatory domain-containing protein [Acidobacteria bacterium]|nr:carboxypeptidase-like regulatory domain-containing protein [Acidobacteriota bacterium]
MTRLFKQLILVIPFLLFADTIFAQVSFKAVVKNLQTKQPVSGAMISVENTDLTAATDAGGRAELSGIPDGNQVLVIVCPGYETRHLKLSFPLDNRGDNVLEILLSNELDEVTITTTTRISREIDDVPTRIEAINEEEIDEKISMRPANISMVLNESTGIKVQQTSATSYTQSIRIQGLDGRYTQILKDGLPGLRRVFGKPQPPGHPSSRSEAGGNHQGAIRHFLWRRGNCRSRQSHQQGAGGYPADDADSQPDKRPRNGHLALRFLQIRSIGLHLSWIVQLPA